jgi:hypothetical protein
MSGFFDDEWSSNAIVELMESERNHGQPIDMS